MKKWKIGINKAKNMKIGNVTLKNNLILAPIAGYSDAGLRCLSYRYGAGLCFTEMVSAKGLIYNNQNTKDLIYTHDEENPKAVQIFGNQPEIMAQAVNKKELEKFDIIDINMGCPVPKIVKNGEGSALMQNPSLVYEIVYAVVKAAKERAVTVKIRTGFDKDNKNAPEVGKAIEAAGASAITVHGRTRDMFYSGKADLESIRKVKKAVKIPVIGNGDVTDYESYNKMIDYCGVDAVMIARGAIGRPYVFSEILKIPYEFEIYKTVKEHLDLLNHLDERVAVNNMKKQIVFYIKGIRGAKFIKEAVFKAERKEDILKALKGVCT